ncbi:hypothetical protein ACJRO7_014162 [Eucalyptus globulus]|uniref:Uncharacterized protein n=1 Tax=Eucalyptus globulus TaxID=34317 RepID=A0ABD3L006_EUCGL
MDLRSWCKCNWGCSDGETAHLGRSGGTSSSAPSTPLPPRPPAPSGSSPGKQRWRELWTRLKKERGGRMPSQAAAEALVPYDFDNYLQNFDQGIAWDEPENLSRSFSVRFADPASRGFAKKRVAK